MKFFCVESNGPIGGWALFWNKKVHIQVIKANLNFIHTICCESNGGLFLDATFIYGNPNFSERRYVWDRLQRLQLDHNNPSFVLGISIKFGIKRRRWD